MIEMRKNRTDFDQKWSEMTEMGRILVQGEGEGRKSGPFGS